MIIEINDINTIGEVCRIFSEQYPFLKIEFFDEAHHWQEASSLKHLLPHNRTIAEVRKRHNSGAIEIHSWEKTGRVEQQFRELFGLNVQIFRRQIDGWVQTVGTDELVLEEQNKIGENATLDIFHGTATKR